MVATGFVLVSLLVGFYIAIGIAYLRRPQLLFRVYNAPTGGSGDHLTADGVRAYRRQGYGIVATGVILLASFWYLFAVR